MRRKELTLRIRIVSGVVVFLALVLVARLYYLQFVKADYYEEKATGQYVHTKTNLYNRGAILFTTRDGDTLSAAAIKAGYVLAVNPTHLTITPEHFCEQLLAYLSIEPRVCVDRVSAPGRTYVELADRLDEETMQKIDALHLDGLSLYRNQWRYYPGEQLSARTIGFVGYSDDGVELRGKYGLERYYEEVLFTKRKQESVDIFAELFSNLGDFIHRDARSEVGDVVTSLEPSVSRMLDSVLQETNDLYESKLTGGIIMNPDTGEIVAMNVVPGFNLNDRREVSIEQFHNPLVEDVYEMGSIIKPLTMAAGLDAGVVTAHTTYYDPGCIELNTYRICNFDHRGRGTVPMQEVLNQSLNTGVSWVVNQMGKDRFKDYFLRYKLGSETGIDLPNETHGLTDNLNSPREVEYATASFGQGIAMTPIETVRALATLGNGGLLVTPHLATRIEYQDGHTKEIRYPEGERVLKSETSEEISRMLVGVVDHALKGGQVALPHHSIGAKTGTAQIADPVHGGYYDDRYLHSFFGYFPAFDPQFIVFMYTVEPKGVKYASETLTDPFMDVAKFLINYYSIPPDR